ncbi:hypothetical protein [Sporosarcina newyorkensis]|uniref:hypothetical protein n=1 Tax=Sporosarcina newyorkensis TaxID=759851 RepID=UPI003CFE8B96
MKAIINGFTVEGTPEELSQLIKLQIAVPLHEMQNRMGVNSNQGSTIKSTKPLSGKLVGNY